MSADDPRSEAEARLEAISAIERMDGTFRVTSIELENEVRVTESSDGDGIDYRLTVFVPTIDSVVQNETVATVVQSGWFETFERRLESAHQAGIGLDPIDPIVSMEGDIVIVRMRFRSRSPERAADNVKTLAEFVEGTWVEGLIPGYEYDRPASTLLERAHRSYSDS